MKPLFYAAFVIFIASCQMTAQREISQVQLKIPDAISNNAVAQGKVIQNGKSETWFYSFNGLSGGKGRQ